MKATFLMLAYGFTALAVSSHAQEAFQRVGRVQHASVGEYTLTHTSGFINDLGEDFDQKLVIEQNGREIARYKGYSVTPADADGTPTGGELAAALHDRTGDGVPELIVKTYTGRARCCWGLHIASLGPVPVFLLDIEGARREPRLRDDRGMPEVTVHDPVFDDYWLGMGESPSGDVVLASRNGRPYAIDGARTAAQNALRYAAGPRNVSLQATLQRMIDLLYAGHGGDAEALLRESWPTLPHGTAVSLYDTPDAMIAAMWCRLSESRYADTLFALNRRAIPHGCDAVAKAPYRRWVDDQKEKKSSKRPF